MFLNKTGTAASRFNKNVSYKISSKLDDKLGFEHFTEGGERSSIMLFFLILS